MPKSLGVLKVDKIVNNKDGSATIYFSGITKEIQKIVKEHYNKKKFTSKLFRQFVLEGLFNFVRQNYPKLVKNERVEN